MTVVFYVSGHGFGHASRDIEVINAFGVRHPQARIAVRTAAPRWLFALTVRVPYDFHVLETDTGVVQHNSLTHDIPETMRRASAFYETFDERVAREAAFLESISAGGPTIVVGDIPPLAFEAAARAGMPAFALGNFTWDWIYEDYVADRGRAARALLPRLSEAYSHAHAAWRLPMHGGFGSIANVIDVPFVARHSHREPEETRRAFRLPLDRRIVLSSFGGYGLGELPLGQVDCLGDYILVVAEASAPARPSEASDGTRDGVLVVLRESQIYDSGFRYEDLVRAADVVITKPGFGIIAECLANGTALVYTSRGQFREYPVLVAEMPKFLRCAFISQPDLFAGRWRAAVEAALGQPPPSCSPRTDGAEYVADLIQRELGG